MTTQAASTDTILQYLLENPDPRPSDEQVEAYIGEQGLGRRRAKTLRAWQQDQQEGRTVTDLCPTAKPW